MEVGDLRRSKAFQRDYKSDEIKIVFTDPEYMVTRQNPSATSDFFRYTLFHKGVKYKSIRVAEAWDDNNAQNLLLAHKVDILNQGKNESSKLSK